MNNDIEFVDTDVEELVSKMVESYEKITGKTLYPADPEKQFILWIAGIIIQERVNINYAAQQNIPSYAVGKHLDALAELFNDISRKQACKAVTTMRFYISEAREDKFLIPVGTRVTAGNITFETTQSVYLEGGKLSTDVKAQCQTVGTVGNGFLPGQIKTLVDVFPYYDRCENITESTGGADTETDLEFRLRLRNSEDTYSTAGSIGAYTYYAKNAIDGISDVAVLSPSPGSVSVYVLMENGKLPNQEELNAVTNAVSADDVRPLTDNVTVLVPETVDFSIDMTFYIPKRSNSSAADIEAAVNKAVDEYITWQTGKLGRDIIPSELVARVMATWVKRVDVRSPVYTVVDSTSKVAKLTSQVLRMNNNIYTADYVSALSLKIREDPELAAMGESIAEQLRVLAIKSKGCTLYSRIDELDEDLLDILAYDFKVDWYSPDYTREEKRAIIKNSFKVHKTLGTKAAVETALGDVYNGAKVVERENEPYTFDIEIDATLQNISCKKHEAVLDRVQYYKNLRSHLGVVQYATLPNGAATTFAGVGVGGLTIEIIVEANCYGLG